LPDCLLSFKPDRRGERTHVSSGVNACRQHVEAPAVDRLHDPRVQARPRGDLIELDPAIDSCPMKKIVVTHGAHPSNPAIGSARARV
jgi:hypothetical protein